MPQLKAFQIEVYPHSEDAEPETVTVRPNVEHAQSPGPNWCFKEWYGMLYFQTKEGALNHFKRVNKKAVLK